METIQIPSLNLLASRLCLGTWAIGGWMWGGSEEQESIKTIHAALELGINIIDTAPVYGFGQAEEIVGKAIEQYGQRERIIIATKAGLEWQDDKLWRNSSSVRIEQEVEDSLKRLRTHYIDLYQIHWPDLKTPFAETAATLSKLQKAGKIRAIGVSNFTLAQIQELQKTLPVQTIQPPYNLFERAIEQDVLPFVQQTGIVTLAYGSLCRGLLSGKIKADTKFNGDDLRNSDPKFQPPRLQQYLNAVSALNKFAQENYGKDILALALRWILDRGQTIALWGARHPGQLQGIDAAFGWSLDAEAMQQIDKILQENIPDPIGPEFLTPPV